MKQLFTVRLILSTLLLFSLATFSFSAHGEEEKAEMLTLEQVVQTAIDKNADLKKMDLDREMSESKNEKLISLGRKLDVEIEEMVEKQHAEPMNPKAKGEIRAELYEMKYQGERFIHTLEIVNQQKELKKLEIKQKAESNYFNVLNAEHQLQLMERAYENAKKRLEMARKALEEGLESKYSLLQAESQLKEMEIQLEQAKTSLSLNAMTLNHQLGRALETNVTLAEVGSELPKLTMKPTDLIGLALHKRIDHQILLADQSFAEKVSKTYQKYYYNFYDGGIKAKREKELEVEKAALEVEESRKKIALQVSQAYTAFQNTLLQTKIAGEKVARSQEAYKLTEVRYDNSMITLQDLLDAQLDLTRAEVDEVNQIYQAWIAYANLENVVGTSLK